MKHQIVFAGILFQLLISCFSQGQNNFNTLYPLGEVSLGEGLDNERVFPANVPSISTAALLLPAPGNDNCANATALIVNGTCISGSLASVSIGLLLPLRACGYSRILQDLPVAVAAIIPPGLPQ